MTGSFSARRYSTATTAVIPTLLKARRGQPSAAERYTPTQTFRNIACRYFVDADGKVQGSDCACAWCQESDEMWGDE